MRNKATQTNINLSDLVNYPNGRIKNNTGGGDGTPVNEEVYGDFHEMKDKLMRLYGIVHNDLPDNEANGYQFIEALIALASKNDYVLNLTTTDNILRVPLKLGKLKNDESFILKAASNKTTETTIKGSLDGVTKNVTYLGDFKENEYVRMVNTSTGVVIIRMIDSFNLDSAVADLLFLKAATQSEENAGSVNNKATTPLRNKTSFTKRVIGADSSNYLAKPTGDIDVRNGLLSSIDKKKIDDFADPFGIMKITGGTNIQVNAHQGGDQSNNFNFNYLDIFPPTGKTMDNLAGFMASAATEHYLNHKGNNLVTWCHWQVQVNKIRIICGSQKTTTASKVNWQAIWI